MPMEPQQRSNATRVDIDFPELPKDFRDAKAVEQWYRNLQDVWARALKKLASEIDGIRQ